MIAGSPTNFKKRRGWESAGNVGNIRITTAQSYSRAGWGDYRAALGLDGRMRPSLHKNKINRGGQECPPYTWRSFALLVVIALLPARRRRYP
jgi:hypothetical protein